jgi:hypothetical protein
MAAAVPPPTQRSASAADAGRSCPYCRFALKTGTPLMECGACRAPHHLDCWSDNTGCAVLGCAGGPETGSGASATPRPVVAAPRTETWVSPAAATHMPTAPHYASTPPPTTPPPTGSASGPPARRRASGLVVGMIVLALAVLAVAAVLLLGKSKPTAITAAVTSQPSTVTLKVGQTATFTAAATGTPTPTVQWRRSQNDGSTWLPVPGATSDTLVVSGVSAAQNGNQYDAVFTSSGHVATTNAAVLVVNSNAPANKPPSVTTQPANTKATSGQNATFLASASGTPAPGIRWRRSTNGGTTWVPLAGATSGTLVVSGVTLAQNGDEYDAVFTNAAGTVTSGPAVLTVNPSPRTTGSTTSQQSGATGSGEGPAATVSTYWQDMADGSYAAAYALETTRVQGDFPNFVADREEGDPVINVIYVGSPQYGSGSATVPIEFYARDRYPNPNSDTLCRLFDTSANMVQEGGQWYYDGLASGGSVVNSSTPDCNG